MSEREKKQRGRGFTTMSPERLREVAARGARVAHTKGTAYRFTSKAARAAQKRKLELERKPRATN